mgnify:CR=1 FL=1
MTIIASRNITSDLPPVRGRYTENAPLGQVGWLKAGGTAEILFKPADQEDLVEFLRCLVNSAQPLRP